MRDPKAANLIQIRLKYDWLVLLFGLLFAVYEFFFPRNIDNFIFFMGCLVFVEFFEVGVYRKVQKGGSSYHMLGSRRLDQDDGFESVLICVILELSLLIAGALFFLLQIIKQDVTWF